MTYAGTHNEPDNIIMHNHLLNSSMDHIRTLHNNIFDWCEHIGSSVSGDSFDIGCNVEHESVKLANKSLHGAICAVLCTVAYLTTC